MKNNKINRSSKHVWFAEKVRIHYLPIEDKNSRKGIWEQLGRDRERFQRRISQLNTMISNALFKKRIIIMNHILGPILKNHYTIYQFNKMKI